MLRAKLRAKPTAQRTPSARPSPPRGRGRRLAGTLAKMSAKPGGQQQATREPEPQELLPFGGAPTHPPIRYTNLVLKSISGPPSRRFALVNDQTFAAGDDLPVKLLDGRVKVRCVEVRDKSVLLAVQGEDTPREIRLEK